MKQPSSKQPLQRTISPSLVFATPTIVTNVNALRAAFLLASFLLTSFLFASAAFAQGVPSGATLEKPQTLISDLPTKLAVPSSLQRPTLRFTLAHPEAFVAGSNPSVELAATSLIGSVKLPTFKIERLGSKGACQLVFDTPLPEVSYTVTFTYKASGMVESKSVALSSVTLLAGGAMSSYFTALQPKFGERFTLNTQLPYEMAPLRDHLVWSYSLGFDQKEDVPYSENFRSPLIPAAARKIQLELAWKHPQTAERMVFASHTMEPSQTLPEFYGSPSLDIVPPKKGAKSALKPNETEFVINGLGLKYDVPIDVDERTSPAKVVTAELGDVEVTEIGIDMGDSRNGLNIIFPDICCGKNPIDLKAPYEASTRNVQSSGSFENGSFVITVRLRNIPKFSDKRERMLNGILVAKIVAKLTNRKAGKTVSQQFVTPVPIRLYLQ